MLLRGSAVCLPRLAVLRDLNLLRLAVRLAVLKDPKPCCFSSFLNFRPILGPMFFRTEPEFFPIIERLDPSGAFFFRVHFEDFRPAKCAFCVGLRVDFRNDRLDETFGKSHFVGDTSDGEGRLVFVDQLRGAFPVGF